ncbi:MAG: tripartite tricarboxylate transporter TctB family protein [Deltaproteobacteria bacterium]|nr:tripartite tricarboxylate transporter TctB family protein [Deltaproteobacteria bacterium]
MNNDQVSSVIWFFIGLTICVASFQYKLGTFSSPSSGFMPLLSGLAICLFSLVGLIDATIRKKRGEGWTSFLKAVRWEKALIVLISLFAYGLLLKPLGFFLCTLLLMGFLFRVVVPQRWSVVTGGSFLITVAAYIVFEVLLKSELPKGFWGF